MKVLFNSAFLIILISTTVFGTWALIPLEEVVAKSDLIIIGTLHSAEEDSEGIGQGYIQVDEIIYGKAVTLEGQPLKISDNLKIKWADNWACAAGMHQGRVGKKGIWLLTVNPDGTVNAGYPGRFTQEFEKLGEIKRLKKRKLLEVFVDVQRPDPSLPPLDNDKLDNEPTVKVDTSPFPDRPARRVLSVIGFFIALYWLMYRSKYRIR